MGIRDRLQNSNGKKKNGNIIAVLALWAVFLGWFWRFLDKGIDVTDQAATLAKYKHFFDAVPDLRSFGTLLTEFTGGVIYKLCGDSHQVFAITVAGWACYVLCGVFVYLTFRKYVRKEILLISMIIGSAFSMTWIHIMNYNSTSMMILTASLCVMFTAMKRKSNRLFFFAGLLIGINVLFRLPNILETCFGLGMIWYYLSNRKEMEHPMWKIVVYALGILTGWVIAGGAAIVLLGPAKVFASFSRTTDTLQSDTATHGASSISSKLIEEYTTGGMMWLDHIIVLAAIVVIWIIYAVAARYIESFGDTAKKVIFAILVLLTAGYGAYAGRGIEDINLYMFMLAPALALVFAAGAVYYFRSSAVLSAMCFTGLLAELTLCFGTDNGLAYHQVFLIFPFALGLIAASKARNKAVKGILSSAMALIIALGAIPGYNYATSFVYRDEPNDTLIRTVDAPEYARIHTSDPRYYVINESTEQLSHFGDQYLMVIGDYNLPYVTTDMKPYLGRVWLDLASYSYDQMEADLSAALAEKGRPVILIMDLERDSKYRNTDKYNLVMSLAGSSGYTEYYSNDWFRIYAPVENGQ